MESKLNQLLKRWPKGTVAAGSWLHWQGIYRQLARRYVQSGWMHPIGHGAFVRAGDSADWCGGVYALQAQLGLGVYAGGETALSMQGQGHYLSLGDTAVVSLFSERTERLPAWFTRHAWGVQIQHRHPNLFEESDSTGFTTVTHGDFSIRASSPERAILEVLHLATTNEALDHSVSLMSGLSTLRPHVVQSLLETCRSVKVKRLFLWAAESAGHAWFDRLVVDRLDLGKGKRALYRGGRFDPKYRITVPRVEETANV